MELDTARHSGTKAVDRRCKHAIFGTCARATRMAMVITDPRQPDNPVVYANNAFLRLTGYKRRDIYGRNCRFLQGTDTDPATIARVRAAVDGNEDVAVEILNYRSDGTPFWNALYVGPVVEENGALLYHFAALLDITGRREAERLMRREKRCVEQDVLARTRELEARTRELEACTSELERTAAELRGREAWLRATFETAPEAIVVVDHAGAITSVNPAVEKVFGHASAEIVGRDITFLVDPPRGEERDLLRPPAFWSEGAAATGSGRLLQGRRQDGSVFPIELAVGEVANGGQPHYVGFVRDLTARERAEAELRQAQKMEAVGQLTGGVAHDFNNLLTVVLGNLELLQERVGSDLEQLLVNEALHAVRGGAELTARLLAFARRQPLDAKPLDLKRQLEEAAILLRPALGEMIRVRTEVAQDLPPVLADPAQLQNAILNLALNARDAMPKGGQLVIEARAGDIDPELAAVHGDGLLPGRYLILLITDTGCGMPPEVCDRAFEPFFTTKTAGTSSGLGLSMVWGFAKQSGGYARIYSEPGQGTTVRLYLPQAEQAVSAPTEGIAVYPATYPGRGETVLVVEDDARVRRYAVARLSALGYRVLEAEHGPAALKVLAEETVVDLLFTDVIMPGGMTGQDLMEAALRHRPDCRVVLTSGYAEPELLQRGRAEGAVWLRKPYTAVDLARTLRQTLDGGNAPSGIGEIAVALDGAAPAGELGLPAG